MSDFDAFDVIDIERCLVLDSEELQAAFLKAGKEHHPDSGGTTEGFESVQRAREILSAPQSRLKHWLELNGLAGEMRGSVSGDLMDLFMSLGDLLQRTDELLREREKASSALAKAMLESRTQECREELEEAQTRLESDIQNRVESFGEIERGNLDGWEVARDLTFLQKWQSQIRERYARLW